MKFAFIVDPLDKLQAYKDSSVAMMREAARRGHEVWTIQRPHLVWQDGVVSALATQIIPQPNNTNWYVEVGAQPLKMTDFDGVMMRQDPPFDAEYVTATWLLERAVAAGAKIFNDPRAIRDHSEKVAIAEFPQLTTPSLIARDADALNAFIDLHRDTILKPLDGMGGIGVFRVRHDDPNRNVIIEVLTQQGSRTIIAQRFLPEIANGDKRILIIDGKPVPYCLARIPKAGETRGNLAVGGRGETRPLTVRDHEIAAALGPVLAARGLLLIGIDVIGDSLTEINVTSPTCFVEIEEQSGFQVAAMFMDALEARCKSA